MNLDDLTLGQIKHLQSLLGQQQQHPAIGRRVIIRTYSAGVHYGTLRCVNGEQVIIEDCIRIWKWAGAFTLSELATFGPKKKGECKFSQRTSQITLTAIEILLCSPTAIAEIESVPSYET